MNRKQKHELRVMELENKKLDVEIKQEQLTSVKLDTERSRQRIAKADALIGQLGYQDGQIKRQRDWIESYKQDIERLSKENATLTQERNFIQDDLKSVRTKLSDLRNTPILRLVSWVKKLFSPAPGAPTCIPPSEKKSPHYAGSRAILSTMSPEIYKMSADEFKKKYIDTVTL